MAENGSKSWMWKLAQVVLSVIAGLYILFTSLGSFETRQHADDTYLRKETFQEFRKGYDDDMKDIKDALHRIEGKLDNKADRRK